MREGIRKLNLTMKVTDSVVKLTGIVSGYTDDEAAETIRMFNNWADDTSEFLKGNFDIEKAEGFNRLAKLSEKNITTDEINAVSRKHADYLQELIQEMVE